MPKHEIAGGDVHLQIDERYTFTGDEGQTVSESSSSSATLSRSEERRFERSFKAEFEAEGKFASEQKIAAAPSLTIKQSFEFKGSAALQFTSGSTRAAQEAFESSLDKGRQLTRSLSVQRQVVGARVDADVSVRNSGPHCIDSRCHGRR